MEHEYSVSGDDCKDIPPLPVECSTRVMVTLLRHGQSTWNKQHIIQGSSDHSTLTDKGMKQAAAAAGLLQRLGWHTDISQTWASPLQRARQTAEIVHQCLDMQTNTIRFFHSLREIDLYSFQGMKKKSLQAKTSKEYAAWQKNPAEFEIDGHAPVRELWYRASLVWNTIFDSCIDDDARVLVVAHNATNQAMIHTALGLAPSMFRRIIQSNASLSRLEFIPVTSGPAHILVHAVNRVPMTSMIEKELVQKNHRKIVLLCAGDENDATVASIRAVDKTMAWTVVDGRGQDLEGILDIIPREDDVIAIVADQDMSSAITKTLLEISRPNVTFVSHPGSMTLLTCPPSSHHIEPYCYTLVCSNNSMFEFSS